ncbi:MAG: hypothetical protein J6W28_07160, partial [Clostridia bacterium]|nr:hypothetical protein [Clostridia bacterium]
QAVRPLKPMPAVGQPPFGGGFRKFDFSPMKHLQNAGIPFSRLHDVGGPFGGNRFVDIQNIFRDFNADENDPASYSFAFTDALLEAMHTYGLKPIFRLGETIENQMTIEIIRLFPPKDYEKWARICEHIIRHYNEGWADGYHYGITYWEIWGEPENGPTPDINMLWAGTPEEYFALYDVTAKHLKACFGDSIKVGGYGSTGFEGLFYHPEKYGIDYPAVAPDEAYEREQHRMYFFTAFLDYIKAKGSPIDFFSWHSYVDVDKTLIMDAFVHKTLAEYGYGHVENLMDEWNNAFEANGHGSSHASAAAASMMMAMQDSYADMLCYYDARLQGSVFGGFFTPFTGEPVSTYYSFVAFGKLYALGTQVKTTVDEPLKDFYAVAATNGNNHALLVANRTDKVQPLVLEGVDLSTARYHMIDGKHLLSMAFDAEAIKPDTVLLIEW